MKLRKNRKAFKPESAKTSSENMQILNVINHEWVNVMSSGKVKLVKCRCCSTPRYMVLKGNTPLISTFYKENALDVYFYEKSRGDDDNVF